jgi:alanyl-tRNA synthetase
MRHSHLLGSKEPIFYKIFDSLKNEMSGNYPELKRSESLIKETLKMEEEKFLVLLDRGIKILNQEISKIDKVLPGEVAFKLYDTFGFPLDLTEDILKNKSLKVDHNKFDDLMKKSKELAKKNWKGSGDSSEEAIWFSIKDKTGPTEFLGYKSNQSEGVILNLLKDNKEVKKLSTNEKGIIITNQTPFYGESGGQLGDQGTIVSGNSVFEVEDTQKKLGDLFVHYGSVKSGEVKIKDVVEMKIDVERRDNLKAYHSATHLLHESLRRTLGKHVMQKGSLVAPDRLRFDFSHMKPITSEELQKIDKLVNEYVEANTEVTTRIMTPKAAIDKGALAFFGEKYGEEVRVVSMGKEKETYFSTELCGGTHVQSTGNIGKFRTISQASIAAGVRRVEALRDKQLEDYIKNKEKLSNLSTQKDEENIKELSSQIIKLGGKPNIDNNDLKELIKNLTKQLEQLNVSSVLKDKTKNIISDKKINGVKVRFQKVQDLPPKDLRKLVDSGKKELGEGIVVVFASSDNKVGLAVGITEKLISKYDAVKFAKLGSEMIGGKGGGGRKDFAQAGGQDQNKIDEAFEKIKALI